jgi:hypothetical protein
MKRPIAAGVAVAFFILVLLSQAVASNALVTPLATPKWHDFCLTACRA